MVASELGFRHDIIINISIYAPWTNALVYPRHFQFRHSISQLTLNLFRGNRMRPKKNVHSEILQWALTISRSLAWGGGDRGGETAQVRGAGLLGAARARRPGPRARRPRAAPGRAPRGRLLAPRAGPAHAARFFLRGAAGPRRFLEMQETIS